MHSISFKIFFHIKGPFRVIIHLTYVNRYTTTTLKRGELYMTRDELGQLIVNSEQTLYNVAKSLLYNDSDCSDAIQEAIVKAFAKIHTLKKDEYAKTWLIRILINECYGILRHQKRIVALDDYADNLVSETQSDYSDLYESIMHLNEDQRVSIVLYYLEGYSIKEIADLQNSTESAIKKRLARARGKLKIDLEGGLAL